MLKPHKIWLGAAVAIVLVIIIGGVLTQRTPQFHPYVVFQATESLQVVFVQRARRTAGECEATAKRITDAMLANCSTCRLVQNSCLEKLDTRQRKILSGQPLDIPVTHMPGGAIAFVSSAPNLADQVCRETERHASRNLPAECVSAGPDGIALSLAKISGATIATVMPTLSTMLGLILLSAVISLLVCYLIIRSDRLHGRFSGDATATGPQKFHATPTPRIGGVAIAVALAGSVLVLDLLEWLSPVSTYGLTMLALSAIPAFAGGFGEDVTKRVGVLARLMLTFAAGVFASLLVGATLDRLDVPGFDALLQWPVFAIAFTAFAVGGIANSINIIDGYNGLAGGYAVIVLAALAWVAGQVGDPVVLTASLAMLGALLGFLLWNYPKGKIFLGDGGAYLLGFWLAELSVLLVVRNPDVSPWFPLLLLVYPVVETLFSIYRRQAVRGASPGHADALHFHQLIYMRLARVAIGSKNPKDIMNRNNLVALYVWASTVLYVLPALFLWRDTYLLMTLTLVFLGGYMCLYSRLVRWRAPAWMIISPRTRES